MTFNKRENIKVSCHVIFFNLHISFIIQWFENDWVDANTFISVESDKPRAVRTTNIEFNQVELSWYAPTEQRNITGFEVLLTDNVTGEVTSQETLPNSRYTVTNLKADRTYKLTVTSLLGSLQGKTSDVLEFVTKPFGEIREYWSMYFSPL